MSRRSYAEAGHRLLTWKLACPGPTSTRPRVVRSHRSPKRLERAHERALYLRWVVGMMKHKTSYEHQLGVRVVMRGQLPWACPFGCAFAHIQPFVSPEVRKRRCCWRAEAGNRMGVCL